MCEALERRYSKERQTAKDQMIKKLLQNGVDESIIADSANVTVEYVVKIKNGEFRNSRHKAMAVGASPKAPVV